MYDHDRQALFAIAYRMLGSATEAEDIVQEAYLRYHAAATEEVRSVRAYLSAIVTRLCLDHLKSARVMREHYIGPWLPEPLLTDTQQTPIQIVEQRESITMAFLVLLERLTPRERAVFLLREVFEYSYPELAVMFGISKENCRQIFHRAQKRIAEGRQRFEPPIEAQWQLAEQFIAACRQGDLAALTKALAHDMTIWSDGGGKVVAARRPIHGREAAQRFILGLLSKVSGDPRVITAEINGRPGILIFLGETLAAAWTLEVAGAQISGIYVVLNPDKLAYVGRQLQTPSPIPPAL